MSNPERKLPSWIDGFMQYTENTEPPRLFRKWTAISCIAAALQRKVRVEWGASLTWYPNLYVVLVGKSATGKGTAMRPGMKILSELRSRIRLSAQATSLQALIRHLKDNNLTDLDPESGAHIYHSSLTVYSEEFTVFLGYNNPEFISTLCNWYDCEERWTYETISRKKEEVVGVWVNLIAGTTPDLVRSSLPPGSIGGGLTSRIIFVYEEKPDKLVTLPTETEDEKLLFEFLVSDLEKISMMSGSFKWTLAFMDAWDTWCRNDRANPPFSDPKFDGYNGRRRVHLMKLAMIVSASYGRHDLVLTEDDLTEASEILNEVEQRMGMTFKGVGKSDIADLVFRATMFLKSSATDEVPFYMFARYFESDVDKFTLDRVTDTLEATRVCKVIKRPMAETIIKILERE